MPRLQHAEGSSGHPLQLRHAASPPRHAALSPTDTVYTYDRRRLRMLATMPAQVPASVIDRVPNWGSPYTGSPPRQAALSSRVPAFVYDRRHFPMPADTSAPVHVSMIDSLLTRSSPDAARPPQDAALSPTDAAFTLDRLQSQMPATTPAQVPMSDIDRLLNGGSLDTERFTRRKSKSPPPPRTKNTRSRRSKQTLPELRQPLMARSSSAHTPDAAEATDGDTPLHHVNSPQQAVTSQPCGGLWQKLGSSLSAVWRWLCKCGNTLKRLSRRVRRKLLTTLGLSHAETQALVVEQQAAEREAPAVSPIVPLQHVEQPRGPSRLQRWRM